MGGSHGPSPWDIWYARNRYYTSCPLDQAGGRSMPNPGEAGEACSQGSGGEGDGASCNGGEASVGEEPRTVAPDEAEAGLLSGPVSIWV